MFALFLSRSLLHSFCISSACSLLFTLSLYLYLSFLIFLFRSMIYVSSGFFSFSCCPSLSLFVSLSLFFYLCLHLSISSPLWAPSIFRVYTFIFLFSFPHSSRFSFTPAMAESFLFRVAAVFFLISCYGYLEIPFVS